MTIRFNEEVEEAFDHIIDSHSCKVTSKSMAIRDAISMFSFLVKELEQGNRIFIHNEDDTEVLKEIVNF